MANKPALYRHTDLPNDSDEILKLLLRSVPFGGCVTGCYNFIDETNIY